MKFSRNEWYALGLTGVGHFSTHLALVVYPALAVMVAAEGELTVETIIGWSFLGYLLFGLGALPVGLLADRIPSRWIVKASVLGIGPSLMALGLVDPGPAFVVVMAFVGLFASFYHPAGMSLISRSISHRGSALGINGICGGIGLSAAPVLGEFMSRMAGWRAASLLIGGFMLLLGIVVSFLPIEEAPAARAEPEPGPHRPNRSPHLFIILLVVMTISGLVYRATSVTLSPHFERNGFPLGFGAAVSLASLVGMIGQFVGGQLADRRDLRVLFVLFHAASLPFAFAMSALLGVPLFAVSAAFLFFNLGMQPIENSLVAELTPDRWRSTAYGLKFITSFGLGSLSVPGVSMIMARYSSGHVFIAVGTLVVLVVLGALVLAWQTHGEPIRNEPKPDNA